MLYIFYGNDTLAVRDRAHTFVRDYEARGYLVEQIAPEEYEGGMLADRAGATPLFSDDRIIVLDTFSEKTDAFDDLLANAAVLGASSQPFVLIEGPLRASEKKALTQHATEIHEEKSAETKRFNVFSMTEALLRRDKKSLWVLLQRARAHGISDEEVVGILYWQVKILVLVGMTTSAEAAGLKPFVYSKTKRALSRFSENEPMDLSRSLLSVYHEACLGKCDIDIGLERLILSL